MSDPRWPRVRVLHFLGDFKFCAHRLPSLPASPLFSLSRRRPGQKSYVVNQSIENSGTVTGTIDTNGAMSTLSGVDFTTWNSWLTKDGASFALTNLNSNVCLTGTETIATATGVSFDFSSASASSHLFKAHGYGSGNTYWCDAAASGACRRGATVTPQTYLSSLFQTEARAGNQIIAGSSMAAAPELASWALIPGGFRLIGSVMRDRRKAAVSFS